MRDTTLDIIDDESHELFGFGTRNENRALHLQRDVSEERRLAGVGQEGGGRDMGGKGHVWEVRERRVRVGGGEEEA